MRIKRSFLPVVLSVMTLAMPGLPSGRAVAADDAGSAANTGLLPAPLTMSVMESAAGQTTQKSSWQDTMNAGIDDASSQISETSQMLDLFQTAGEIASKVENADQFTKAMQETGKFAEAFGEVFSQVSQILDLAKLGLQIYDCVTALLLDEKEVFVAALNTLVRDLVVSLFSEGGALLGQALGALAGSGVASVVTGFLGGVAGGWLGEIGGKLIYDHLIADPIKDIGSDIYDFFRTPDICADLKYAAFASGAYGKQDAIGDLLPADQRAGWQEAEQIGNDDSGYHATVYERRNDQGEVEEVVVSYRGTEDWKDWGTDIVNFLGWPALQYTQAAATAKEIKMKYQEKHPDAKVSFTGHSLGGGLAQYAAAVTNLTAVTFNPAAPSKWLNIISLDSLSEITGRLHDVTNYVYAFDPVQLANLISDSVVPLPLGTWKMGIDRVILGSNVTEGHGMATIWKHFADTCINRDGTSKPPPAGGAGGAGDPPDAPPPGAGDDKPEDGVLPPTEPNPDPPKPVDPGLPDWEDSRAKPKKSSPQPAYNRHTKYDQLVK